MCHKCLFRMDHSGKYLGVRSESSYEPHPGILHHALRFPCRHDKKRIRRALTTPLPSITDFLKYTLGTQHPFAPYADLLLEYGEIFGAPDISDIWEPVEPFWQCFNTALKVEMQDSQYVYAEGISIPITTVEGAMLHAWNVHETSGKVLDLTWPMIHWNQYFGIIFDTAWTKEHCKMPHAIFYPDNWPHNERPVREYLSQRKSLKGDTAS